MLSVLFGTISSVKIIVPSHSGVVGPGLCTLVEGLKSRVNDVSELAIDRHALRVNLLIDRYNKETL